MSGYLTARVKSVLSADTLILVPSNHTGSTAPVERQLSLAYVQSPRLSNNEIYAFEAREVLRKLLINRVIKFKVLYTYPAFGGGKREFGDIKAPIFDSLIEYLLEKGCVKVKDINDPVDEDYYLDLKDIQEKTKTSSIGLWSNANGINVTNELLYAEIEKSKVLPINAIVEKVISGDRLLVRFLVSKTHHVVAPVLIGGVKSPRVSSDSSTDGEPFGNESKYYVELHLLLRDIKVKILGESANGVLVGKIIHPAGNISEKLLENGLAEVVDWQSSIIGFEEMSLLRAGERLSKVAQKGMWKNKTIKTTGKTSSDSIFDIGSLVQVSIAKIISTDTVVVRTKDDDKDYTVQLSSLRAPRLNDPSQAPFVPLAKEYLRKKIIGKSLKISIDGIREKTENFDERPVVSIIMNDGSNISENIVKDGWATVIRHKRGDDDRSPVWDKLIELEAKAIEKKLGINGKLPPAERIVDASENAGRSKTFLATFSNRSKISAVVDYVSSPNRFRLVLPKEGVKLVLVLGGLSNKSNHSPELAKAALNYVNKKVLQRDVTIDIFNVDKVGGFIGNLYVAGQSLPLQYNLLSQGFYEIHDYSIEQTKFADQLWNAQEEAQNQKIGIWVNYQPEEANTVSEINELMSNTTITKKYYDIECNDISDEGLISFQIINEQSEKLIPFMEKFHEFHQHQPMRAVADKIGATSSYPQVLNGPPKRGDIVSAAYSKNGKFYRAKIISYDKTSRLYKVQHIDFGNFDEVTIGSLRQLPSQFSLNVMSAQGHVGTLSFIDLPPSKPTNYLDDSLDYLFDCIVAKPMVAAEDKRSPSPGVEMSFTLYDAAKVKSSNNTDSVNKEMTSEGWAIVHKVLQPWEKSCKNEIDALRQLEKIAKSQRKGCWEFGDIENDI